MWFFSSLCSAPVHFWITQSYSCQVTSAHRLISSIWFLTFSHNIGFIFILILILNLFWEGNWNMQQKFSLNIKVYPRFRKKKKQLTRHQCSNCIVDSEQKLWTCNSRSSYLSLNLKKAFVIPFLHSRQNILQDVKKTLTRKIGFWWRRVVKMIADTVLFR